MAAHKDLTGTNLHELKGADGAAAGTVPVADGSGSTAFAKIGSANLDTSSIFGVGRYSTSHVLTDVSTASSIWVPVPRASTLTKVYTCLQGAVSGTDSVVTVANTAGSTACTITVTASGSAAGDVDIGTPASNNTFTAGQFVKISTDGGSTNTVALIVVLEFTQTA